MRGTSRWAEWLRAQMAAKGWTVKDLAARADPALNGSTIYYQLQRRSRPTRLCRAAIEKASGRRFTEEAR